MKIEVLSVQILRSEDKKIFRTVNRFQKAFTFEFFPFRDEFVTFDKSVREKIFSERLKSGLDFFGSFFGDDYEVAPKVKKEQNFN